MDQIPDRARKGRGAVSNRTGRYEAERRVRVDDGWAAEPEEELPPLRTTLAIDASRTIISRNQSPDVPFDRSINPFRGCEHGCIYCFARPTHAYLGLSPGLDFETRLFYKPNAPVLLARELSAPSYEPRTIALGANTDPYQPVERTARLTRRILEVLRNFNHPVGIVTKSALIVRDLDILAPMAAKGLAKACVSLTTLDGKLARVMEPRAATPACRLATIRRLVDAGVPVTVLTSPIIPGLNDEEIERLLEAAAAAGAAQANYILLRLPLEIKQLFEEWLGAHFPDRRTRVLALMRESRGGALYDPAFGRRMTGTGPYAEMIASRFRLACGRLGLGERRFALDTTQFRVPRDGGDQLDLL